MTSLGGYLARRFSLAGGISCLLLIAGCAGIPVSPIDTGSPATGSLGYRALFRGDSEQAGARRRFRLAVAIVPPDRVRLEFFGPAPGPRLILAATSESSLALMPAERIYDRAASSAEAVERFFGLPLDAPALISLLTGRPMCSQDRVRVDVMTRPAATFGRTLSWYKVSCPPASVRYEARCEERGGSLLSATVRDGISGAIILEADYGSYGRDPGPRWPRQVRLRLPGKAVSIHLSVVEGPWESAIPEAVFVPEIPEGFESRTLTLFPEGAGLPGTVIGPGR